MKRRLYCLLAALVSLAFAGRAYAQQAQPAAQTHSTHGAASTHTHRHRSRRRSSAKPALKPAALAAGASAPGSSARLRHATLVRGASPTGSSARLHHAVLHRVRRRYYERFTASSFTDTDITSGDISSGEDPVVRQAAIDALGNMNGTVVAIDPSNGRILAMVNQKLALSSGAEPCSTIKISVALAALQEGIVNKDTPVSLGGRAHMNMTQALAHSNNLYFETLGRQLGFERVRHYAMQFGLGELAGWNIPGEQLGTYPDKAIPLSEGGVGRMCSFGQGVSMTPLQLGAMVAAIANGGTLYYLQHPTTPAQVAEFQPKVKRTLDIARLIPSVMDGMEGAVDYGTARSLRTNFADLPILGKTGTCSNDGTRYGWFASFADTSYGRIVTVFFLEGGRPTFGPKAAELTGVFYHNLWDHSYFAQTASTAAPPSLTEATSISQ